jgi:hypothetical protein
MHSMPSFAEWSTYVDQPMPEYLREKAQEMRTELQPQQIVQSAMQEAIAALSKAPEARASESEVSWDQLVASHREPAIRNGIYQHSERMARDLSTGMRELSNPLPKELVAPVQEADAAQIATKWAERYNQRLAQRQAATPNNEPATAPVLGNQTREVERDLGLEL